MAELKQYFAMVKYPTGERKTILVQGTWLWDADANARTMVQGDQGEVLYVVPDKYNGLLDKLNALRDKHIERRLLVHCIFADRITPMNGSSLAELPSGQTYELQLHPTNPNLMVVDNLYVVEKEHFYSLSSAVN